MSRNRSTRILRRGTLVLLLCFSGCHYAPDIASRSQPDNGEIPAVKDVPETAGPGSAAAQPIAVETKTAGNTNWLAVGKLPYQYSEIVFLDGKRIGFTRNEITASDTSGPSLLRLKSTSLIEVTRGGQLTRQEVEVESIERADGTLERYSEVMRMGVDHTETSGHIKQEKLRLSTKNLAAKDSPSKPVTDIDWPKAAWGPLGVQQILMSQPLQPGQIWEAQVFVPIARQMATVRITAGRLEETTLPGNKVARLLPVDVVMTTESGAIESRNWINKAGEILKNRTLKGLDLASYRAPREEAERFESEVRVDIIAATSVQLDKALPNPLSLSRVVFEVAAENLNPFNLLSKRSNQALRSVTTRTAEVTVYRIGPDTDLPISVVIDSPSDACRKPTAMIQSHDPAIEKLAVELTAQAKRPADIALLLTRGVFERIKKKNFSRGFLSAAEVAMSLEGDCTEHSVLLAALLRNRGIPSRLASGLVYTQLNGQPSMAYHLWVEAWLDERWIPLDATLGGTIGCGHIKFLETPLEGDNPYAAMLPVMNGMSQLSIRVLDMQ